MATHLTLAISNPARLSAWLRVNITLPKRVLRRLDDLARAEGQGRGAFISHLTLLAHGVTTKGTM
jgi:hypothetical protein